MSLSKKRKKAKKKRTKRAKRKPSEKLDLLENTHWVRTKPNEFSNEVIILQICEK